VSTDQGSSVSADTVNIASGDADVETQIGRVDTLIENANVVHHSVTYEQRTDRPPNEERFRIARRYLDGGAHGTAAEQIGGLIAEGYASAKVAYYWALAILSGRPFDHLNAEDFSSLRQAYDEAASRPPDGASTEWHASLHVIEQLLDCFIAQESPDGSLPLATLEHALKELDGLLDERQEEILRHLGMIMHGVQQDHLDAKRAQQVMKHRMGNERRRRVPLFFQPEPRSPQRRVPPRVEISVRRVLVTVGGGLAASLGGYWLAPAARQLTLGSVAVSAALLVIGGIVLC
jgi:hypothetical protein